MFGGRTNEDKGGIYVMGSESGIPWTPPTTAAAAAAADGNGLDLDRKF